jgi:hypothetical protein
MVESVETESKDKGQHEAATATSTINTMSITAMMRGSHIDFARSSLIYPIRSIRIGYMRSL